MATSATKYYKISYGIVEDDEEDRNPDWMCQIMYEVLQEVAPKSSSRTYAVYKVPMYDKSYDWDTYKVFALIKCSDESSDGQIVKQLRVVLEEALKQSDLYTMFGLEKITEISCKEFTDLSEEHCEDKAT